MRKVPGFLNLPNATIQHQNNEYSLYRNPDNGDKKLLVEGNTEGFNGMMVEGAQKAILCDLTPENAAAMRSRIGWLSPKPLGLVKSFGFGDRLGLATPGHIDGMKGFKVAPVFAQQSVRENTRTGRTPQNVMDDAMWGVLQAGWMESWGADADHIKLPGVLDAFINAGYSMFTIDPGDFVEQNADNYDLETLQAKVQELPWDVFGCTPRDFVLSWMGKEIPVLGIVFDERTLLQALAKYGRAVAHTVMMFREICKRKGHEPFDFEVSVDETDSPTTIAEHFFIATELRRMGVKWTSLAPRFVGRFEKGVDYIGDLAIFDRSMQLHAEVAKFLGGYKISLHSGSDKFSVYPSVAHHTNGVLHVKTAGTSYLEALRVIALMDGKLFKTILDFSVSRYTIDKASYHVSAEMEKIPQNFASPAELLDNFDARQVFHVTYGSVLERFGSGIFEILKKNEVVYYKKLEKHFRHHIELLN